ERVTSIALIPLVLWAVYSGFTLAVTDYAGAVLWAGHPVNAVLLILLLAVSFIHMHAGLRVVIEDYIHTALTKSALLLLNLFVCVGGAALAIFCVLKVAFTGAAV
ncbi:MAG: succinate dehydrogenase, hydrophobic membrane anchor protein, partial [Caulobacteraceae bacterium]